ncbi:MAG: hypothetical protein Q4G40_11970 [Brachybacterium sp.]|nr:hypothetical protein [Brachybacterium sp.]
MAGTTHQRGYGWAHRQGRDALLAQHQDGAPCWWCGQAMYRDGSLNFDGRALNADHVQALASGGRGTKAGRLLHDRCNKERGDGSRDHRRPTLLAARRRDAEQRRRADGALVAWPPLPDDLARLAE